MVKYHCRPPTWISKAPFATSTNGLLTMSSIQISSEIDVTRTNVCILLQPSPFASSLSALWTYGWMASITCSSIHDAFIVNCQFGRLQLICLLTLVHRWIDRWGWICFRCPMSLDGWHMSSIYPPMLLLRSTSFWSHVKVSILLIYCPSFMGGWIDGWMDWWLDG